MERHVHEATGQIPKASVGLLGALEHEIAPFAFHERERGHSRVVVVHEMPLWACLPATILAS